MGFWQIFRRLVWAKPRKALGALYWHITRRRLRARNQLLAASADLPFAYKIWMSHHEKLSEIARNSDTAIKSWSYRPTFQILLHGNGFSSSELKRSVRSAESQVYANWIINDAFQESLDDRLSKGEHDFVVLLRVGDTLSKSALFHYARAIQSKPAGTIFYGDQDELGKDGNRRKPWFKPEWNEEMFLAQDYLSSAIAIQADLAKSVAPQDIDRLVIKAAFKAGTNIIHIPHILCHVPAATAPTGDRRRALREQISNHGAKLAAGPFGTARIQWPLPPQRPKVSIIVPTKDRLDLLNPCIESVLKKTTYVNFEILIVDNLSIEPATAAYFAEASKDHRIKVLSYPHPYNFSSINNFAIRHADGSFVCMLNNDTEVIEGDWLTEMMRYAVKPNVGAVGAKLLYPDGSIQHAGVIIGIGDAAGHAHRFLPGDNCGYFAMAHISQYVSAVTAACLVVSKDKFLAVGGLDEEHLAVAFNDVDFCLKLQSAGWRNVYVPHAVLTHHESKSRGNDLAPAQVSRYRRELTVLQDRWGTRTARDPLHNPNLDRCSETFVFRL